jgi:hypothetical protein
MVAAVSEGITAFNTIQVNAIEREAQIKLMSRIY